MRLETRPIVAPGCSCGQLARCAACLVAYREAVRSVIPLVLRVVEGGDVCGSCCQAVSALARDGDLVADPETRRVIDDAVGDPAYCEADLVGEPPCEANHSHRWEWVLCRYCEGPATFLGRTGSWICERCAERWLSLDPRW